MHVEKQMQIIELITSVGVLTITKMKDGSNEYCVMFYNMHAEYDKDLGQALLNMLADLFEHNYFTNEEQKELIKDLLCNN